MSKLYLIFSADQNWGIGKDNDLLVSIPEDMKDRFKALTLEKTVVMGKKTLLSLPGQKGLPKRRNYVLTRQKDAEFTNAETVNSIAEFFDIIKDGDEDVFVIGGGEIYRQLMPYCSGAYVTKILKAFDGVTAFVPSLDEAEGWQVTKTSEVIHSVVGVDIVYVDYVNLNVLPMEVTDGQ